MIKSFRKSINRRSTRRSQRNGRKRQSFLTAPDGGWLHNKYALKYGDGVFYSFPVKYVGRYELSRSVRTVEFPIRKTIVQEAMGRIREESKSRQSISRQVPMICRDFLEEHEPEIVLENVIINISSAGIVIASEDDEEVIAFHRMPTISFAVGGDYEDYDCIAYVAKTKRGRKCFVFDCGMHSNEVLATLGQAFVTAREEMEEEEAEFDEELEEEFGEYANQFQQLTDQEYQDLYGASTNMGLYATASDFKPDRKVTMRNKPFYSNQSDGSKRHTQYSTLARSSDDEDKDGYYADINYSDMDSRTAGDYEDVSELRKQRPVYSLGKNNKDTVYAVGNRTDEVDYDVAKAREPTYDIGKGNSNYSQAHLQSQDGMYAMSTMNVGKEDDEGDYDYANKEGEGEYCDVDDDTYTMGDNGMSIHKESTTYDHGNESGNDYAIGNAHHNENEEADYDVGNSAYLQMGEENDYDIANKKENDYDVGNSAYLEMGAENDVGNEGEENDYDIGNGEENEYTIGNYIDEDKIYDELGDEHEYESDDDEDDVYFGKKDTNYTLDGNDTSQHEHLFVMNSTKTTSVTTKETTESEWLRVMKKQSKDLNDSDTDSNTQPTTRQQKKIKNSPKQTKKKGRSGSPKFIKKLFGDKKSGEKKVKKKETKKEKKKKEKERKEKERKNTEVEEDNGPYSTAMYADSTSESDEDEDDEDVHGNGVPKKRPEYSKMKQKKEAPSLPPRVYRESMPQTKAEFLVDKLNIENGSIRAHGQRKSSTTSGWTFIDPNVLKKAAKE
eukprot:m.230309 g.230309  ORF g.230309 m.230309 type:complete len:782 (-) comp13892_c0_seq1:122-2467(-)